MALDTGLGSPTTDFAAESTQTPGLDPQIDQWLTDAANRHRERFQGLVAGVDTAQKTPETGTPQKNAGIEGPPKPEPFGKKSVGGFLTNLTDDAAENVRAIGHMIFVGMPKTLIDTIRDPAGTYDKVSNFVSGDPFGTIWDAVSHNYRNGLWDALYYHPVSAALDASTLLSLGGGSLAKLGGLGKLTETAGVLGELSEAAKSANSLERLGNIVATSGKYLDPIHWAGLGLSKALRPAAEAFGFGEHTPFLGRLWATGEADTEARIAKDNWGVFTRDLPEADKAPLVRAAWRGSEADLAALSPAAKTRLENWRKTANLPQEAELQARRLVTDEDMLNANAIGAGWIEHGRKPTAAELDTLKQRISSGELRPSFTSMFRKGEKPMDFFEQFNRELSEKRFVSRLERRTGSLGSDIEMDPNVLMAKTTVAYHKTVGKLRFLDSLRGYLAENGILKVYRHGPVPEGFAPLSEGIYRKYFEDAGRLNFAANQGLAKGLTLGKSIADAAKTLDLSPKTFSAAVSGGTLLVPKHIAAYVNRVLRVPGPWARMYDRVMGLWKTGVTLLSPRYWMTVLMGNTSLGMVYGITPGDVLTTRRLLHVLPEEIRNLLQPEHVLGDRNFFQRGTDRLGQYSLKLHNAIKQAIFVHEGIRDTAQRLGMAGPAFFSAADAVADELARVSSSPVKLMDLWNEMGRQSEQMAATLKGYPEGLARAERLENLGIKYRNRAYRLRQAIETAEDGKTIDALSPRLMDAQAKAIEAGNAARELRADLDAKKSFWLHQTEQLAELHRRMPALRAEADAAERWLLKATTLTGTVNRLHPVERDIFKRIVPFYTFTKAMTQLAFRMPFLMPKRTFFWNRLSHLWNDIFTKDQNDLPDWTREYLPVAATEDGGVIMVKTASWSHWSSARTGTLGEVGIPSLLNVAQQNPLVKMVFDLSGGTNPWSKKPISPGEMAVRLDNGQVIRYDNGHLKSVVAQPSLWRSLWYMFPQSQLIESVLMPYQQTDRGWLLNPDPIRRPDGTPMYPKELFETLSGLVGLPQTTTANLDQLRMQERRRIGQFLHGAQREMKFLTPEARDDVRNILRDHAAGVMDKFVMR